MFDGWTKPKRLQCFRSHFACKVTVIICVDAHQGFQCVCFIEGPWLTTTHVSINSLIHVTLLPLCPAFFSLLYTFKKKSKKKLWSGFYIHLKTLFTAWCFFVILQQVFWLAATLFQKLAWLKRWGQGARETSFRENDNLHSTVQNLFIHQSCCRSLPRKNCFAGDLLKTSTQRRSEATLFLISDTLSSGNELLTQSLPHKHVAVLPALAPGERRAVGENSGLLTDLLGIHSLTRLVLPAWREPQQ